MWSLAQNSSPLMASVINSVASTDAEYCKGANSIGFHTQSPPYLVGRENRFISVSEIELKNIAGQNFLIASFNGEKTRTQFGITRCKYDHSHGSNFTRALTEEDATSSYFCFSVLECCFVVVANFSFLHGCRS